MSAARTDPVPRYWAKVEKTDGCWFWRGAINHAGYGTFNPTPERSGLAAHRYAVELASGIPVPKGLVVDHLCRTRNCVNPDHLRVTTQRTNTLENSNAGAARNAAKTQCKRGHAPNWRLATKPDGRTYRTCRECEKLIAARPRKYGLRRLADALKQECETAPYRVLSKSPYINGRARLVIECPFCHGEVKAFDGTVRSGVGKPCTCGALLARDLGYKARALV